MKEMKFGRKQICKAGGYSRTVSLPKVWLENVGLDVGDDVELAMSEDGSLLIQPAEKK